MGGPVATRTPAQAADTIVWLTELSSGAGFRDRERIPR